jgi:hypothetical protein
MTEGAPNSDHHPHGSMGEEAVKLAEAVQDWLGERTGRGTSDVWAAATAPGAFESPECRICPICRGMRLVTSMSPDVLAHLADAATSLAAAVRAMGEPVAGSQASGSAGAAGGAGVAGVAGGAGVAGDADEPSDTT